MHHILAIISHSFSFQLHVSHSRMKEHSTAVGHEGYELSRRLRMYVCTYCSCVEIVRAIEATDVESGDEVNAMYVFLS